MAALIQSINTPIPNSIYGGYASYTGISFRTYKVASGSNIFPGLVVAREGTNFQEVISLDQLSGAINAFNIVGVVAQTKTSEVAVGADGSLASLRTPLAAGTEVTVINFHMGTYYGIWGDSSTLADNQDLYLSKDTTGSGDTTVYPGMFVKVTYNSSSANNVNVSASALFDLAPDTASVSISQFDLLPTLVHTLNR